eukprot:GEMP01053456.1.p2 GENE.GEMP01053456.1~~GEMP01053456.1.p2  ORF type:complete len:175 (+),score=42.20 GEMP01053456.1:468-992(+)
MDLADCYCHRIADGTNASRECLHCELCDERISCADDLLDHLRSKNHEHQVGWHTRMQIKEDDRDFAERRGNLTSERMLQEHTVGKTHRNAIKQAAEEDMPLSHGDGGGASASSGWKGGTKDKNTKAHEDNVSHGDDRGGARASDGWKGDTKNTEQNEAPNPIYRVPTLRKYRAE